MSAKTTSCPNSFLSQCQISGSLHISKNSSQVTRSPAIESSSDHVLPDCHSKLQANFRHCLCVTGLSSACVVTCQYHLPLSIMCYNFRGGDSYQNVGGGGGGGGETLLRRPGTTALRNLICHPHTLFWGPVKSEGGGDNRPSCMSPLCQRSPGLAYSGLAYRSMPGL